MIAAFNTLILACVASARPDGGRLIWAISIEQETPWSSTMQTGFHCEFIGTGTEPNDSDARFVASTYSGHGMAIYTRRSDINTRLDWLGNMFHGAVDLVCSDILVVLQTFIDRRWLDETFGDSYDDFVTRILPYDFYERPYSVKNACPELDFGDTADPFLRLTQTSRGQLYRVCAQSSGVHSRFEISSKGERRCLAVPTVRPENLEAMCFRSQAMRDAVQTAVLARAK